MSTLARKLILAALGILAGAAVWPAAELVLYFQPRFASYLPFLAVLGAVTGLLLGAVFGTAEGITSRIKSRIPAGLALGALIGLAGGAVGLLAGQAALWLFGEAALRSYRSFRTVVLPVSRAVGWAVLGLFVAGRGCAPLRSRRPPSGPQGDRRLAEAALEYAALLFPKLAYPRLLGFLILGLAIGVFYGLVERGLSYGVLRLLAGPLKGKEFLLNQRRMNIGQARSNQIALPGYQMADRQAQIRIRRGEVSLANLEPAWRCW
jgi:MFS family permease